MIEVTFLAVFQFFGACDDGTPGFMCHYNCTCRNRQGVLLPLPSKFRKHCDETGLSCFLKGSCFDPARSYLAVNRSGEFDWTGFGSLHT